MAFEETHKFLEDKVIFITASMLLATDAFAFLSFYLEWVKEILEPQILTILSILGIILAYTLKISIRVDESGITVFAYYRKRTYPKERILDVKKGDIDILRNYGGWVGKRIHARTYAVPGIDSAVSVKLGGKEVLTFTTNNPDEFYNLIYEMRRLD